MGADRSDTDERLLLDAREAIPVDAGVPIGRTPVAATADNVDGPALARRSLEDRTRAEVQPWRTALANALLIEWERGTAFLFVPVLMAIGSVAYFAAAMEPPWVPLLAGGAVAMAAALALRQHMAPFLAAMAAGCVLIGAVAAKVETTRLKTGMLGGEISTRLSGRVVLIEHMSTGRYRLTLDVMATERPVLRHVPERVRVSARKVPQGLAAGDVVVGIVWLLPPSGPLRPGGYDFSFESYFDSLGANGFFLRDPERSDPAPPAGLLTAVAAWIENTRTALAERIESHIQDDASGEIAAALVAGVRAGIPEEANEALRRTGLAHILSISGLHMALVAATVMTLLRSVLALFPGFASRRPVKKYAASAALVALAVYLLISGAAVAAERSFIMITVMLAALLIDRAALTMRNLALAAIAIIAVSPHEVMGPSFQMSFAATAALVGAYTWWSDRRRIRGAERTQDAGPVLRAGAASARFFGGLAATSLVAGFATAAYGAYHFHRVATVGLAANLVAMPVVSIFVMPFAVIATLLIPFGLDGPFYAIMGYGLGITVAVASWFADMSPVDSVGAIPAAALTAFTLALVCATMLTTWLRAAAIPLLIAAVATLAFHRSPDMFVAEDGRLVGLVSADGLMLNRSRPSAFTAGNWQLAARKVGVKPLQIDDAATVEPVPGGPFACRAGTCAARSTRGELIVHAATAEDAWPYCRAATVIIITDATASDTCSTDAAVVITTRDLGRRGSAAVYLDGTRSRIAFAFGEELRPWHAHRKFSRESRGLPPYRSQTTPRPATDG